MRDLLLFLCVVLAAASFETQLEEDFLDFSFNELEDIFGFDNDKALDTLGGGLGDNETFQPSDSKVPLADQDYLTSAEYLGGDSAPRTNMTVTEQRRRLWGCRRRRRRRRRFFDYRRRRRRFFDNRRRRRRSTSVGSFKSCNGGHYSLRATTHFRVPGIDRDFYVYTSFCVMCPAGKYGSGGSTLSCTNCGRMQYNNKHGQDRCNPCPSGLLNENEAQMSCYGPPSGTFVTQNGQCGVHTKFGNYLCKCGVGYVSSGPQGGTTGLQYKTTAQLDGSDPPAWGASTCTRCSHGWYQDTIGQRHCKYDACKMQYWYLLPQDNWCANGPNTCPAISNGGCVDCRSNAQWCPTGQFRSGCHYHSRGSCNNCDTCAPGQYRIGCGISSYGQFPTWGGLCVKCPSGKFKAGHGAWNSVCVSCPTGKYQQNDGQSTCVQCQKCNGERFNRAKDSKFLVGCGSVGPGTCVRCHRCASGYYNKDCACTYTKNGVSPRDPLQLNKLLTHTCPSMPKTGMSVALFGEASFAGTCTKCGSCPTGQWRKSCEWWDEGYCVDYTYQVWIVDDQVTYPCHAYFSLQFPENQQTDVIPGTGAGFQYIERQTKFVLMRQTHEWSAFEPEPDAQAFVLKTPQNSQMNPNRYFNLAKKANYGSGSTYAVETKSAAGLNYEKVFRPSSKATVQIEGSVQNYVLVPGKQSPRTKMTCELSSSCGKKSLFFII